MTTLASIEAVRLSCSRQPGGTFPPIIVVGGDPAMADGSPDAGGGVGGSSGHSSFNGRWKRDLELGGGEQPPPSKRMSPIPPRGQDPAVRDAAPTDSSHPADPAGLNLGDAVAAAVATDSSTRLGRGGAPRARTWQASFRLDGLLPHHTREVVGPTLGRAHTTSPTTADGIAGNNMNSFNNGNRPLRSYTMIDRTVSPPPKLWENVPAASPAGESLMRPSAISGSGTTAAVSAAVGAEGISGFVTLSSSSHMLPSYRRDVLKPSPQQNAGMNCKNDGTCDLPARGKKDAHNVATSVSSTGSGVRDSSGECGSAGLFSSADQRGPDVVRSAAGDESLGGLRRSMKRPLGGGLRASSSWDGGSASNAPPGSGGGFSAPPACRSCGGGGAKGNGSEAGEGEVGLEEETCSCKGVRASLCLSPLPFLRSNSSDAIGHDSGRHGSGEEDMFSDHMLSNAFSPPSSPTIGAQPVGGGEGGGGTSGGVHGLEMLVSGGDMHDISDCMRTLQGSPTHDSGDHADHGHSAIGMGLDGAVHHNGFHAAGEESEASHGGGDMDVESPGSRLGGTPDGGLKMPGLSEVGPKVGDNHQAVIPTLSAMPKKGDSRLSPQRSPPLQLWKPGIVSDAAAKWAFPQPRPDGAGSAELEQKMLSAHLVYRAEREAKRQRREPPASSVTIAAAGAPSATGVEGVGHRAPSSYGRSVMLDEVIGDGPDGGGGGAVGGIAAEDTSSLEKLSNVVDEGEGARWRTDWSAKDRAAFRKGVFAFRRDFQRIRAGFLPEKSHSDVVEYFYRRWKRDPEYPDWKCTEQLVGRRVAKIEERYAALRRGWVICKELSSNGGFEQMFRVIFPKHGSFPSETEIVDLGTLETLLMEGSVTEEERKSEAMGGPRVAATRRGALFSSGHHHSVDSDRDGDRARAESRVSGGTVGGRHMGEVGLGLGSGLGFGRRLGWNSMPDSMRDHGMSGLGHGRRDLVKDRDRSDEERSARTRDDGDDEEEEDSSDEDGRHDEDEEEDEEETEGNEGDGGGSGSSDSGPEAETDSTTSISAGGAGVSPVSTSHASFSGVGQSSTQSVQDLVTQSPSSGFSPMRTPPSSSLQQQQEQQELLLQQTPPLLQQPRESVSSSCMMDRGWDVDDFDRMETSAVLPASISNGGTGLGEQQPLGENVGGKAAGNTEATLVPGR